MALAAPLAADEIAYSALNIARFTWGARRLDQRCRMSPVESGEGDGGGEPVVLPCDGVHAFREVAEADDAVEVADVAVVEHEVVAGAVVADVVDFGVSAGGDTLRGERSGESGDLLDPVEVGEGEREWQLVDQVVRGRVVGEGGRVAVFTDCDGDPGGPRRRAARCGRSSRGVAGAGREGEQGEQCGESDPVWTSGTSLSAVLRQGSCRSFGF